MPPIKFTVTFTGEVAPDGNDPEAEYIALTPAELHSALDYAMRSLVSNGGVTGESPATLEEYSINIQVGVCNDPSK